MLPDLACRHALLLQGPAGPFFRRLAEELRAAGIEATKVNFHAGDALFFPGADAVSYRGPLADWAAYLRQLIQERGIDAIFLFGDLRPYHRAARAVAAELGVAVWVFEEGYLRPDYITLEQGGVNGNSAMPRDPDSFRGVEHDGEPPEPEPTGPSFGISAVYSALNAAAFTLFRWKYPHYRHHRDLNVLRHAGWWLRGGLRKARYGLREKGMEGLFEQDLSGRYFFVPLQVFCDYQLAHSPFHDVEDFIALVTEAFAREASPSDSIVFKHHPMDRPFRDYTRLFQELSVRHGLGERLLYVHDVHLPTLLRNAKGTITINSTVGLSSLYHGTPVKTLGDAVYDVPGLTHSGDLEDFLREPGTVDRELFESFRRYLLEHNQINGNFYRRLPGRKRGLGVNWFPSPGVSSGDAEAT